MLVGLASSSALWKHASQGPNQIVWLEVRMKVLCSGPDTDLERAG